MSARIYRIAVVCTAFLAASLLRAQASDRAHLPAYAGIKTVGIISAVGDTFMFEHVGASPWQWLEPPDASFLEIGDWGIDAMVTREAAEILSKEFTVKPVTFDEGAFDSWTWSTLLQRIDELPPPMDDIDAYVVILRDWRGDEIGGSVDQVGGLGLYRRDVLASPRLGVFACYRIAIIDANDDRILATRAVLAGGDKLPWLPAAPSLWPATQNDLTETQKTTLQKDARALIDDTLKPALDGMLAVR